MSTKRSTCRRPNRRTGVEAVLVGQPTHVLAAREHGVNVGVAVDGGAESEAAVVGAGEAAAAEPTKASSSASAAISAAGSAINAFRPASPPWLARLKMRQATLTCGSFVLMANWPSSSSAVTVAATRGSVGSSV